MASQPHQEPPSYTEEPAPASTQIPIEPPTYDDVAESQPRDQLMTEELPCLIMDDCFIYAESQPTNSLHELSNPPTTDKSAAFAVEKFIYCLTTNDGEGALRQRKRHLYDFRAGLSEFGDVVSRFRVPVGIQTLYHLRRRSLQERRASRQRFWTDRGLVRRWTNAFNQTTNVTVICEQVNSEHRFLDDYASCCHLTYWC